MKLNSTPTPAVAPTPAPEKRTRMQSLMFDLQQQVKQSPELSARLQSLPEGKAFTQALGRLSNTEPNKDDVKALQRFLIQLPGVDLGGRTPEDSVDGNYGPRSQNALKGFFETQFSEAGLTSLTKELSLGKTRPAARPDTIQGVNKRAKAGFEPVQNFGQPGANDGKAVQSKIQIDKSSYHAQYDSNIAAARDSDCGPATAAMVLESQGYKDTNSGDVREDMMGVTHTGATTTEEVAQGIRKGSSGGLQTEIITGNSSYANNPTAFLNKMRDELAAGKQIVLLTKNLGVMEGGRSAAKTNGHYVVIQGITADNQLITADPGKRDVGLNRTFSADTFFKAYAARANEGMPNNMIVISKPAAAE